MRLGAALLLIAAYGSAHGELMSPGRALPEQAREALCGEPPRTDAQKEREVQRLKGLEKTMPPVGDQFYTGWCHAFVTADLINVHLKKSAQARGDSWNFDAAHLIAPIEIVAASSRMDYIPIYGQPTPPVQVDVGYGQEMMVNLFALRKYESVRSSEQMPFRIEEYTLAEKRLLLEEFMRLYPGHFPEIAQSSCIDDESVFRDKTFRAFTKGIAGIDRALYEAARDRCILSDDGRRIENYDALAALRGEPRIKIPPMAIHRFKGRDEAKALRLIRQTLDGGHPLTATVCACRLPRESDCATPEDPCGPHAMTIVGAGFENGKCMIRLRNSWGASWEDGGYITLPVETYLDLGSPETASSPRSSVRLSWITAPSSPPGSPKAFKDEIQVTYDDHRFVGSGGYFHGPEPYEQDGVIEYADGSSIVVRDGYKAEYRHARWEEGELTRYNGTTDHGYTPLNGTMYFKDGTQKRYQDGKVVP